MTKSEIKQFKIDIVTINNPTNLGKYDICELKFDLAEKLLKAVYEDNLDQVKLIINTFKNCKIDIAEILYDSNYRIERAPLPEEVSIDIGFPIDKDSILYFRNNQSTEIISIKEGLDNSPNTGNILMYAIKFSSIKIIKEIIEAGISVDSMLYSYGEPGQNTATLATNINRLDVLKLLEEYGFDLNNIVNYEDHSYSPLMCASYHGHTEIIKFLVNEVKVDINKNNSFGESVLFFASEAKSFKSIELLIELGAELDFDNLKSFLLKRLCHNNYSYYNEVIEFIQDLAHEDLQKSNLVGELSGSSENSFYELG